jgi:beta-mannanase
MLKYFKFKTIIFLIVITISLTLIVWGYKSSVSNHITQDKMKLGLFTRNKSEYTLPNIEIKHYFSVWGKDFTNQNQEYINTFNKANKEALLTVEPWGQFNEGNDRALLLNNIKNNKYHDIIKDLCSTIETKSNTTITIRWGHEMELFSSSRYPWAYNDGELFIYAYRKWVDTCRQYSRKVQYMWSPASNNGQEKYYPGDNYVDIIGMSWYSYPAFEWYTDKTIRSFEDIMNDKYSRLTRYKKPIYAAEFGIAGTKEHKEQLYSKIADRQELKKNYPLLAAIILFSDKTESWVEQKIEAPDWTIPATILEKL